MLEVTLLRVQHKGLENARRLLDYLPSCDVFSPEFPWATEENCTTWEEGFERSRGMARSRFLPMIAQQLQHVHVSMRSYFIKQYDYLHRQQVSLWSLERLAPHELKELRELWSRAKSTRSEAHDFLSLGFVDAFLARCHFSKSLEAAVNDYRDRVIARNLDNAESRIRERYPRLRDKSAIRLVISVGALHHPERYARTRCTVVDLTPPPASIEDRFDHATRRDQKLDEVRRDFLAYGAHWLAQQGRLALTEERINGMSDKELADAITTSP